VPPFIPPATIKLLQVLGPSIGVSAVLAALLGLCVLLCSGTLSWKNCLTYTPAWDTLTWFAGKKIYSPGLQDGGVAQCVTVFRTRLKLCARTFGCNAQSKA
jgi:di/tricarboxylate transporter